MVITQMIRWMTKKSGRCRTMIVQKMLVTNYITYYITHYEKNLKHAS